MRFLCLVAMLWMVAVAPAHAELGPFVGQLAGHEVILAFAEDAADPAEFPARVPESLVGRLYYRRYGKEIDLVEIDAAMRRYAECAPAWQAPKCDAPTGYWDFSVFSAAELRGVWRKTPESEPLSFSIRRADEATRPPGADGMMAWACLLGPEKLGPVHRAGKVAWRYRTHVWSKVSAPVLLAAPHPAAMNKINATLQERYRATACEALEANARDGEASSESKVWVATERYFSVGGSSGGYFGGAHPLSDFGVDTFDMATGEEIDFDRYYKFVQHPADVVKHHADTGCSGAKDLSELASEGGLFGIAAKHIDPTDECWQDRAFCPCSRKGGGSRCDGMSMTTFPTKAGLGVAPTGFAEVERYCRDRYVIIPWREARKAQVGRQPIP